MKPNHIAIEELWQEFVLPVVGWREFKKDRMSAAMRALKASIASPKSSERQQRTADVIYLMIVWQVLTSDVLAGYDRLLDDLLEEDIPIVRRRGLNKDRQRVIAYLQNSIGSRASRCSPISVVLPRELAERMLLGFAALDAGEVHDIFKPTHSGRHGDSYSWSRARLRACEHVHFLMGRGYKKGEAQKQVAEVTFINTETLRAWERELKDAAPNFIDLQIAHAAGEFVAGVKGADAFFCKGAIVATAQALGDGNLRSFAEEYRARFGARHLKRV